MSTDVSPKKNFKSSDRTDLPPLRNVIARHGLAARRSLGQHFLLDLNLTDRIARAAGQLANKVVVEIGSGPGGLTRSLLNAGARKVFAVERDPRCIRALQELGRAYRETLEVVDTDALEFRPRSVLATDDKCVIVANLPYNIATTLLINWLHDLSGIESMTLMFQKEVAKRIASEPGSSFYGRLSVIAQWLCDTKCLFDVPRHAFVPPPKVTSTLVQLVPKTDPTMPAEISALEAVTRAAFGQRRKMLRSSLKGLTESPEKMLAVAGIDADRRAETLTIEEFCVLARAYRDLTRGKFNSPPEDA